MEYAISIKLSATQYHVLKEIARQQYRTIGNCYAMLAAEGLRYYTVDNETPFVERMEGDANPKGENPTHYSTTELEEIIANIAFIQ